jgi:hypothetical protein
MEIRIVVFLVLLPEVKGFFNGFLEYAYKYVVPSGRKTVGDEL